MTRNPEVSRVVQRWRAICLVSVGFTLTLTAAVLAEGLLPGEVAMRNAIVAAATPHALALAEFVSFGGTWRGLLPATGILLVISADARRRWWLWGMALIGAPLIGEGWQELVRRTRPHGTALGFPSGHATAVAAFAIEVIYLAGRSRLPRGWQLVVIACAVGVAGTTGLTRIVLQAHWPADVLSGFGIGTACASGGGWWDAAHGGCALATRGNRIPVERLPKTDETAHG
jgi:undecaprenyl-diphosphatase